MEWPKESGRKISKFSLQLKVILDITFYGHLLSFWFSFWFPSEEESRQEHAHNLLLCLNALKMLILQDLTVANSITRRRRRRHNKNNIFPTFFFILSSTPLLWTNTKTNFNWHFQDTKAGAKKCCFFCIQQTQIMSNLSWAKNRIIKWMRIYS